MPPAAFERVASLYPGVGDPWPGPTGNAYVQLSDAVWIGKYTYGMVLCVDGEIWGVLSPNQPAAAALGLNNRPF